MILPGQNIPRSQSFSRYSHLRSLMGETRGWSAAGVANLPVSAKGAVILSPVTAPGCAALVLGDAIFEAKLVEQAALIPPLPPHHRPALCCQ